MNTYDFCYTPRSKAKVNPPTFKKVLAVVAMGVIIFTPMLLSL